MSVGSLRFRSPVRWTPRCCHWCLRRKQATCHSARQRDDSRCLREIQVAWPYLHQCRLEICLHRMQSRWLSHQERGTDNRGSEGFLSVPEEDSSIWRLMRRPTVKTWFCAWIAFYAHLEYWQLILLPDCSCFIRFERIERRGDGAKGIMFTPVDHLTLSVSSDRQPRST